MDFVLLFFLPKRRYSPTRLHGVIIQNYTRVFTAIETSIEIVVFEVFTATGDVTPC